MIPVFSNKVKERGRTGEPSYDILRKISEKITRSVADVGRKLRPIKIERERRERMEDLQIIELYWRRDEQAITETDGKYGPFCHRLINPFTA